MSFAPPMASLGKPRAAFGWPPHGNRAGALEIILESAAFAFHMCVRTSGLTGGIASRVFLSR